MSEMTVNMTMTSLEIAEFCGKRHDNVLTDVRNMLIELGIDATEFSVTQTYGNNNTRERSSHGTVVFKQSYNLGF